MRVGASVWWAVLVDERQGGEHDAAAAGFEERLIDYVRRKAEIAARIEELNQDLRMFCRTRGPNVLAPGNGWTTDGRGRGALERMPELGQTWSVPWRWLIAAWAPAFTLLSQRSELVSQGSPSCGEKRRKCCLGSGHVVLVGSPHATSSGNASVS
jgi:hypothetical protein